MSTGSTGSTFPRWQLALLLGAPVALTLGYLYYRQSSNSVGSGGAGDASDKKKKSLDSKTVSIDEGADLSQLQSAKDAPKPNLTPLEQAIDYKNKGNEQFRRAEFQDAIEFYDKAIHNCPSTNITELSTFYQNRAAAYENLKNWEAVKKQIQSLL